MTLQQMSAVKRWQIGHRHRHPVEGWLWDVVLTLWVMSLLGVPVGLLIGQPMVAVGSLLLGALPSAYAGLRRVLHRRGVLRCDWLRAAQP